MSIKSKQDLEVQQRRFLNGETIDPQEAVRIANDVLLPAKQMLVASFFNLAEVELLASKLAQTEANHIKVFITLNEEGGYSMAMCGAKISNGASPEQGIFPVISIEEEQSEERGVLADKDCPPHCQDNESKVNNLLVFDKSRVNSAT